jgi:hypothetical protein
VIFLKNASNQKWHPAMYEKQVMIGPLQVFFSCFLLGFLIVWFKNHIFLVKYLAFRTMNSVVAVSKEML